MEWGISEDFRGDWTFTHPMNQLQSTYSVLVPKLGANMYLMVSKSVTSLSAFVNLDLVTETNKQVTE